jgi:hypothetical protein
MISGDRLEEIYNDIRSKQLKLRTNLNKQIVKANGILKETYNNFSNRYPRLFQMIIENRFTEKYQKLFLDLHKGLLNKTQKKRLLSNHKNLYEDIVNNHQILSIFKQISEIQKEQNLILNKLSSENSSGTNEDREQMREYFKKKYPDFAENQSMVFNNMIDGHLEHSIMLNLISTYKKYRSDQLNDHDASVEFGQVLVDKLVKPKLPPPRGKRKKKR